MYKSIDLFAGIGGIRKGFDRAFGKKIKTVFVSEWDEFAQKTYKMNYHDKFDIAGDITQIDEKEKYWIEYYNSYGSSGYNATKGGDGGLTVTDARDAYGYITNDEVVYLRRRYVECKYPSSYIYECEFKHKISKRGFQAIWLGENSKHIMPEVFTQENKEKQIKLSRAYEGVLRRRVSLEEKQSILLRIKQGEKVSHIWKTDYKDRYKSLTGFRDMTKVKSLDEEIRLDGTELEPLPPL